nr:hypothetical protein [Tanacetum cinerariifolium]
NCESLRKKQVAAHDDKWVPFFDRVKISSTNIRLENTVPQKEETFQVVINLIKKNIYAAILVFHQEGVDFTDVPNDDIALTFLIDLGYNGAIYKYTNMFVDHMHQPWRTQAAIINKCLSGKTANIAYQIDHRKEKRSRRKNMPYPRFTKIIINHFLKQHKSLTNLNYQHYHTINDDGIIFPKKSRGKSSQGKKIADDSQEIDDVSKESKPEPEPVKKKTSSKRRVKKIVTLSADDNIITRECV